MLLKLLTLTLLLLTATADDAYTACACVRKRLNKQPCFAFVRHAVPRCAPSADRSDCEQLCCESCQMYGDDWPVCRSAALRRLCDKYPKVDTATDSDEEEESHSDAEQSDVDIIGPKMKHGMPKPTNAPKPDKTPKSRKDDPDSVPSPESELDLIYSSSEPVYTPELLPSPEEDMFDPPAPDQAQPTPVYYPAATPDSAGRVDPPFDATNEGELDLAPANGRPFAPAACECMSLGTGCSPVLAAASGVCRPRMHATEQGIDCHFACCRICIVNSLATYCDDAPIVQACGLVL